MAQSIDYTLNNVRMGERAAPALWKLRLASGWTVLLSAMVGLFALSWDIQWHSAVGRDRTLTAPHLFILGSITLAGLVALAAVLSETVWARRRPTVAASGTVFAGFFSSSPGVYLVGYGALDAAIGFPLDQYWHTLYGIDVSIWAPFHIMVITGFCVIALGGVEMLATGAHLAMQMGAKWAARISYAGVIVALAALMGLLTVLLPNALTMGYITLGGVALTVYPLMLGAFGMFVLVVALRALPWPGVATCVALVYALFGLANFPLIPALMNWLLGIEQQSLRANAPLVSVLAVDWQYGLVAAAVLLDLAALVARNRGWSLRRTNWLLIVAGVIGLSAAALLFPAFMTTAQLHALLLHTTSIPGATGLRPKGVSLNGQTLNALPILALSLLLGILGVYLGNWFGTSFGTAMHKKERT